jgi:prepilin-type N-terminal cleavage/methylation domain-containing protein
MNRRGYTMVEMIVVLALLSVLMVGATVVLASLIMHVSRQRSNYQQAQVAGRFAEDLRRDVRTANRAEVMDIVMRPASGLTLQFADGTTVVYAATDDGVERVSQRGDTVESRELYRITDAEELRFSRAEPSPGAGLVRCVWKQAWRGPEATEQEYSPLRDHVVEAALRSEVQDE